MFSRRFTLIVLFIIFSCGFFSTGSATGEESYSHLAKAIELYHEGIYDESFEELTAQVNITRFCALAYYYRARIRVIKKEYSLAEASLKAALRDSSGYIDAVGLHAYILKEMGREEEALSEWKYFIDAAGSTGDEPITLDSIVLPEEYHENLEQIQRKQLETQMQEQEEPSDSVLSQTEEDSLPIAVVDFIEQKSEPEPAKIPIKFIALSLYLQRAVQYLIVILFVLIILYIIGKRRKSVQQHESDTFEVEVNNKTDFSEAEPEEFETMDISNEEQLLSDSSPDTPFTRALKLKKEREKYAREIERLMKKV